MGWRKLFAAVVLGLATVVSGEHEHVPLDGYSPTRDSEVTPMPIATDYATLNGTRPPPGKV